MAALNALFCPFTLKKYKDSDILEPQSEEELSRIRLAVFEHIMVKSPYSTQQQLKIKVLLPDVAKCVDYPKARDEFSKYNRELKKLEQLCQVIVRSYEGSVIQKINILKKMPDNAESNAEKAETAGPSTSQEDQGVIDAESAGIHPLLRGTPGRELVPAVANPAAFSPDSRIPSLPLCTLPATEFDEHPVAKDLSMTQGEKASLGLILPREPIRAS